MNLIRLYTYPSISLVLGLVSWWGFCFLHQLSEPEDHSFNGREGYAYASKTLEELPRSSDSQTVHEFAKFSMLEVFHSRYHCLDLQPRHLWLDNLIRNAINIEPTGLVKRVLGSERLYGFYWPERQGGLAIEITLCGLCHQTAYFLAKILADNGVPSTAFGLNGHVVTRYEWQGEVFYIDPDFGVGPFEAGDSLKKSIEIAYAQVADKEKVNQVVAMYLSEGNNGPYYSMGYLNRYALSQRVSFYLQGVILLMLYCLGVIFTYKSLSRLSKRST